MDGRSDHYMQNERQFSFFWNGEQIIIIMTLGIIIKLWISLWASAVNQVNINLKNMLFASDKNTKMKIMTLKCMLKNGWIIIKLKFHLNNQNVLYKNIQ